MKIVSTIEARMSSSRLPGKVLMLAAGRPMLAHLVDRLKEVGSIDEIVVATTVNEGDAPIVDLAEELGVSCFRGSEEDVMGRVVEAAGSVSADLVVEITGDCPLIDPEIIQQTIDTFLNNSVDYVSNTLARSYPVGMDTQVFRLDALRKSEAMTKEPLDREHVTYHILKNPDIFTQIQMVAPKSQHWPDLGLTLDEPGDYEFIKRILEHFDPSIASLNDILELVRNNRSWLELNSKVTRKGHS